MKFGLGLPGTKPEELLDWGRRADAGPFTTVGILDRMLYGNPEPLVTLAAIAGATSRLRVQTEVLLVPLRDPALVAKQAATLDRISGGRFTLGIGLGARTDDYQAAGVDTKGRGQRLDEQMALIRRLWAGEDLPGLGPVGPAPLTPGGPEVLVGAFVPAAIERTARCADGFISAAPVEYTDPMFRAVEAAWTKEGRSGQPRLVGQCNVALGSQQVVDEGRRIIGDYYAFMPEPQQIVDGMLTSPEQIRAAVKAYGDMGADEVIFYCWSPEIDQLDRLADLVG